METADERRCTIGEPWTAKPRNLSHHYHPAEKKASSCPGNGNFAIRCNSSEVTARGNKPVVLSLVTVLPHGRFLDSGVIAPAIGVIGVIAPAGFGQDKGDAKKGGDVAMCVHTYGAEIRRGHSLRLGENN